jgi:hypothetical protein
MLTEVIKGISLRKMGPVKVKITLLHCYFLALKRELYVLFYNLCFGTTNMMSHQLAKTSFRKVDTPTYSDDQEIPCYYETVFIKASPRTLF